MERRQQVDRVHAGQERQHEVFLADAVQINQPAQSGSQGQGFDPAVSQPGPSGVQSRTGSSRTPHGDASDEETEEVEFPAWRPLMQLAWKYLCPDQEPPRKKARLPQFAAGPSVQEEWEIDCFPDSPLVLAALDSAMEAVWSREWDTPSIVSSVPTGASAKPTKWVKDFKKRYYVDSKFQVVPFTAPKPSHVESSWLKRETGPKSVPVPSEDVQYIESLSRSALFSLGSADWLFGTLRHLLAEENQDVAMIEQTWAATTRALRHATQWTASAVTASTLLRRKSFLASCQPHKVPEKCKNWLLFQPLPTNAEGSLFGNVVPTLDEVAKEEGQAKVIAWAARASSDSPNIGRRGLFRGRQSTQISAPRQQNFRTDSLSQRRPFRGRVASRGRGRGFSASRK